MEVLDRALGLRALDRGSAVFGTHRIMWMKNCAHSRSIRASSLRFKAGDDLEKGILRRGVLQEGVMRTVILGGNGFVGAALGRYLSEKVEPAVSLSRPKFDLNNSSSFHLIPADTECLVHAAGVVGNVPDEDLIWQTNVISTYALVRHINNYLSPKLLVYLSSGAVYGPCSGTLTTASSPNPPSLYGLSKLLAETVLSTVLTVRVVLVRLFFPFGPGQRLPRFIPRLVEKLHRHEPIEINPSPDGLVFNPIYIDDLVWQLSTIMNNPEKSIYNLGGEQCCSLRQFLEMLADSLNLASRFMHRKGGLERLVCRPDLPGRGEVIFKAQIAEAAKECLVHLIEQANQ